MNKSTKNGSDVQDDQNPEDKKVLTIAQVKEVLRKDLHSAILCLSSIHDDQDSLNALATHMHGKYLNHLHKQALAAEPQE